MLENGMISMYTVWQNIFWLSATFFGFVLLFVVPAFIIMGFKLHGENLTYNLFASLTVGTFFMVNIVYFVAAINELHFWGLLFAIYVVIQTLLLTTYRKRTKAHARAFVEFFYLSIKGLQKRKIVFYNWFHLLFRKIWTMILLILSRPFDIIILLVGTVNAVYVRCYHAITQMYFPAPDVYVHTSWTQHLLSGEIFTGGVYPMAMHNLIAAESTLLGIHPVTLMRFFGPVIGLFIVFALYFLLKYLFKSQAAVGIGFIIYTLARWIPSSAPTRQAATLPQELGMLFLFPCAVFLIEYIRSQEKRHLLYLGCAFAMTLASHFYVTIIAIIMIIAIFIVHLIPIIKRKLFVNLVITALISSFVAVLPFTPAFIGRIPWEPSMYWATRELTGDTSWDNPIDPDAEQQIADEWEAPDTFGGKVQLLISKARSIFPQYFIALIGLWSALALVLFCFILLWFKKMSDYALGILALCLYVFSLLLFQILPVIGFPVIIDETRCQMFLAYVAPVVFCIGVEIVLMPLAMLSKLKFTNFLLNIIVTGLFCIAISQGQFEKPAVSWQTQYNSAILQYYKIASTFERHKWTIVSSVDEVCMLLNYGWHYELSDLVYELAEHEEGAEIRIPSDNLFFFIEKRPLHAYRVIPSNIRTMSSAEQQKYTLEENFTLTDASVDVIEDVYEDVKGHLSRGYTEIEYRRIIMAKAYYWMQEYKKYFPEITVYYEDDDLVVYRLIQEDPYAVNNLSIDYGYN